MSATRITDPVLLEALRRAVDRAGQEKPILAAKLFTRADCLDCAECICDECVPTPHLEERR